MKIRIMSHALAACFGVALSTGLQAKASPDNPFIVQSEAFLNSHPDLKYRNMAMGSYLKGSFKEAMVYFKRAAYYADKPSQGMIGEMHWRGEGVPQNKAEAYAWLDLAAERQYPDLLVIRERYWKALSEAERLAAVDIGKGIYEKYGDAKAKNRLEIKLRMARMNTTGSRAGYTGSLKVYLAGPDGQASSVDGSQFYQDKYWKPEQYWKWQDTPWVNSPTGKVKTSDLMPVKSKQDPDKQN